MGQDDEGVTLLVCAECQSHKVQMLDWVDANLPIVIGTNEVFGSGDIWCENCQDHVRVTELMVRKSEYMGRMDLRRRELEPKGEDGGVATENRGSTDDR